MNSKKNILVLIDWFSPGYLAGGPVQSVTSLIKNLNTEYNFLVLTTNCDLDDIPYKNIEPNKWVYSEIGCEVFYSEKSKLSREFLKKILCELTFDLIYINSFFSKYFSIIPLSLIKKQFPTTPIVFAPRGMLGKGALQIKRVKKSLFIWYSRFAGLHKGVVWQATSNQEREEILKVMGPGRNIKVLSNIPKILSPSIKIKTKEILELCFISRISEKKNLLFALEALTYCKSKRINFNIYGPTEDENYWSKCKEKISELPKNITATYRGVVSPGEVEGILAKHHVMLLPTYNENFGHSIVESLMCGCPVIISNQTPWTDVEENRAGFSLPLSNRSLFTNAIEYFAAMSQEEMDSCSKSAASYIRMKINLDQIIAQYKKIFDDTIKNRPL